MIYVYVSGAFLILIAAGFGVSRLWRFVKQEICRLYDRLISLEGALKETIHSRADSAEKFAQVDLEVLKSHTAQAVLAARADVQRVEQLVTDHVQTLREDAQRLVGHAQQMHDEATAVHAARTGRRLQRVERA